MARVHCPGVLVVAVGLVAMAPVVQAPGEPFPRYGPVDFLFMALSTVAILLGWGSELLGRGWASELLR